MLKVFLVEDEFVVREAQESPPTPQLKALILQLSAFFMVKLSHPYMTTRIAIALTIQTLVGKVMSFLFNMLCRFVSAIQICGNLFW